MLIILLAMVMVAFVFINFLLSKVSTVLQCLFALRSDKAQIICTRTIYMFI